MILLGGVSDFSPTGPQSYFSRLLRIRCSLISSQLCSPHTLYKAGYKCSCNGRTDSLLYSVNSATLFVRRHCNSWDMCDLEWICLLLGIKPLVGLLFWHKACFYKHNHVPTPLSLGRSREMLLKTWVNETFPCQRQHIDFETAPVVCFSVRLSWFSLVTSQPCVSI